MDKRIYVGAKFRNYEFNKIDSILTIVSINKDGSFSYEHKGKIYKWSYIRGFVEYLNSKDEDRIESCYEFQDYAKIVL